MSDPANELTLEIADLLTKCGQPGEVQLFALLSMAAWLVSEADKPEEAGVMALMSLSQEIRYATASLDS